MNGSIRKRGKSSWELTIDLRPKRSCTCRQFSHFFDAHEGRRGQVSGHDGLVGFDGVLALHLFGVDAGHG